MAVASLATTIGSGAYLVVAVLYFTRIIGLSPTEVGVGMSIAGFVGLLSGVPMGHLADRIGARELLIGLLVLAAPVAAAIALVENMWQFVVVGSALAALDRGSAAVRGGLIASTAAGPERIRIRAYLRSVINIGMAVGAAIGALALLVDTRAAYVALLMLNGVSYLVAAFVLRAHPKAPATRRAADGPVWIVFRDRPYVVVTLLMATMAVQYSILDVGIPLWVDRYTTVPTWIVAVMFVLNTTMVILFQVSLSRRVETVQAAVRAVSTAGVVFLVACGLFALASGRDVGVAVLLLLAGGVVHGVGELMQAAAQFCLSQELAAPHAHGSTRAWPAPASPCPRCSPPRRSPCCPSPWDRPGGGSWAASSCCSAWLYPAVAWAGRTASCTRLP
jgi:MFS family permease